ncbi:conserved Plasmodium protein, unknown function [Plasmodium gaboni]|uniref:Rad21/Rec8-like protein N-terminal domain-containing protein n=1 Tax=Plasmodium gaboni TaxID=647221 RepID=A0ABY1URP5_9APIC|nr:conserved Plasmodium protein, unknown function [Plasmodium gaboni]
MKRINKKNCSNNDEKNLLIYDKSSKIGCIYFIGMSTNMYRGKIILKKNSISEKIVRYTNLNDHLLLIKNGDFNFKQTAILIKGITALLHRQFEVLLSDFYSMYKKLLYSHLNININNNNNLNGIMKKLRRNKKFKIKKNILSLHDVDYENNDRKDLFMNNGGNYLYKNKNIANINDILLKESNELHLNDYNFGNDDFLNEENMIYKDMLTNSSSFQYSKVNNFYTVNVDMNNFNTNAFTQDMKTQSNINHTLIFNEKEQKNNIHNIKINNISTDSLFTSKDMSLKENDFSYSGMMNSILFNNDIIMKNNINEKYKNINHELEENNYQKKIYIINNNNHTINNNNNNNKKRMHSEIDDEIILKDNVWYDLYKKNKKYKMSSINYVDYNFKQIDYFCLFSLNKEKQNKKNNTYNTIPFVNFYKQTKNYISLDARKELYNLLDLNILENQKSNMQPNNLKLIQTKSSLSSSFKGKTNKKDLNFEQLRQNFNENFFLDVQLENNNNENIKKRKYSKNDSSINISYDINYDFDQMSDLNNKIYDDQSVDFNNNRGENKLSFQYNNNNNITLSDNFKETLSVPSSKLVNRRSCTSSQNNYDEELQKLKKYISKLTIYNHNIIEFDNIFPTKKISDKNISLIFYNLLVLASNDELDLIQNFPNNKILIQVY